MKGEDCEADERRRIMKSDLFTTNLSTRQLTNLLTDSSNLSTRQLVNSSTKNTHANTSNKSRVNIY